MLLENDLEVWLRKANDKLDRIFFIEKEWKRRGERENKYLQDGRNYEWLLNLSMTTSRVSYYIILKISFVLVGNTYQKFLPFPSK